MLNLIKPSFFVDCALYQRADLSSNANDTTGWAETSVAGLEGLWVATLAEIVGAGVDDESAL
jgi:hypothetical protein